MQNYKYEVLLLGHSTIVRAFNEKEAIILAQAEAIKNARNYELISIQRVK